MTPFKYAMKEFIKIEVNSIILNMRGNAGKDEQKRWNILAR